MMEDFIQWFFGLKMDAVVLPWLEANKYTIGFILGLPYLACRWYRQNVSRIKSLNEGEDAK
jgi:hypothetical protein